MSAHRSSRRIIVYGFLMVIALLMAITTIGLQRIQALSADLGELAAHRDGNEVLRHLDSLKHTSKAITQTTDAMLLLGGFGVLLSIAIALLIHYRISNEIKRRLESEQDLRNNELRERTIRENILDGVFTLDTQGTILSCNKACQSIFGYGKVFMLGRNASMLLPYAFSSNDSTDPGNHPEMWQKNMLGMGREVTCRRCDNSTFPAEIDLSRIEHEGVPVYIMVVRDITERKEAQKKQHQFRRELEQQVTARTEELARTNDLLRHEIGERTKAQQELTHLATHDTLTGLPNRSLFAEHVAIMMENARRHGRSLALLFLDLDGFKAINDTHGHNTGDALLQEVCARMRNCVRKDDIVARMGGDEFTILLGEQSTAGDAAKVAEKLIAAINEPIVVNSTICQVGVSIGISLFPHSADDTEELLRLADDAMYSAKAGGKNRFCYSSETRQESQQPYYPLVIQP